MPLGTLRHSGIDLYALAAAVIVIFSVSISIRIKTESFSVFSMAFVVIEILVSVVVQFNVVPILTILTIPIIKRVFFFVSVHFEQVVGVDHLTVVDVVDTLLQHLFVVLMRVLDALHRLQLIFVTRLFGFNIIPITTISITIRSSISNRITTSLLLFWIDSIHLKVFIERM